MAQARLHERGERARHDGHVGRELRGVRIAGPKRFPLVRLAGRYPPSVTASVLGTASPQNIEVPAPDSFTRWRTLRATHALRARSAAGFEAVIPTRALPARVAAQAEGPASFYGVRATSSVRASRQVWWWMA